MNSAGSCALAAGVIAVCQAASASGTVLTAGAMDAHNTFAAPDVVKPAPFAATARAGKLALKLPAKSIVVVAVQAANP
jgi:alpha-N-arabinofuranosidase